MTYKLKIRVFLYGKLCRKVTEPITADSYEEASKSAEVILTAKNNSANHGEIYYFIELEKVSQSHVNKRKQRKGLLRRRSSWC